MLFFVFAYIEEECLVRFATYYEKVIFYRGNPSLFLVSFSAWASICCKATPVREINNLIVASLPLFWIVIFFYRARFLLSIPCGSWWNYHGSDEIDLSKFNSLESWIRANRCHSSFPESLCGWNSVGWGCPSALEPGMIGLRYHY